MTTQPWIYVPNFQLQFISPVIDLSGSAVTHPLYCSELNTAAWGNEVPTCVGVITGIFVIYTEASSADAGIGLTLGRPGDTNQFWSANSDPNKAQWDIVTYTGSSAEVSNDRIFTSDNGLILVSSAGAKTGAGEIQLGVNISLNYKDSVQFSP